MNEENTHHLPYFDEVNKMYTMREAIEEAKRCLHCKVPQCKKGCPIENNIPDFIHELSKGNMGEAMAILHEKTNLPAICGRVCPHEKQCEGHCVLGRRDNPVRVGKLESFIAQFDAEMNLTHERIPEKTRGKVAVIGSGPAGLTVAGDLARQGFNVTIFEGQPEPGGVLMYGIPEFRLPKAIVQQEIDGLKKMGVDFECNMVIGKVLTIDELMGEYGYEAVFVGSGAGLPRFMGIPGESLKGVYSANEFLTRSNLMKAYLPTSKTPIRTGKKVAVVGGGNVAMDAARTAQRLGGDVTVIYRRTQEEMPAIKSEYEAAVKEGVNFMWKTNSIEFLGNEKGRVRAIRLATPDGEHTVEFDRVFLAIGSRPASRIVGTTKGIDVDEKGYVIVGDRPKGMTTRRGVFAGGDVVHRPQTVVLAMKAAKEVAVGIAQYVDAIKLLEECGQ